MSALLDDLHESGLLASTLVVMAGEFGRTPHISPIAPDIYKTPGRDHWTRYRPRFLPAAASTAAR